MEWTFYLFPNLSSGAILVELWEWISNFIPLCFWALYYDDYLSTFKPSIGAVLEFLRNTNWFRKKTQEKLIGQENDKQIYGSRLSVLEENNCTRVVTAFTFKVPGIPTASSTSILHSGSNIQFLQPNCGHKLIYHHRLSFPNYEGSPTSGSNEY